MSNYLGLNSVPRYFECTLVTAYMLKGVRTVHADHDKITALKFSDFNLGDHKVYNTLALYK